MKGVALGTEPWRTPALLDVLGKTSHPEPPEVTSYWKQNNFRPNTRPEIP